MAIPGPAELIIICIIGLFLVGGIVGIVLLATILARGSRSQVTALKEENQNLREQLAALQSKPPIKVD